jgi:hypothetical protein
MTSALDKESEDLVMVFDKPHFIVKLHQTLLEVDLKEGVRKKLEDFVESNPHLRESLGVLFQTVIPVDVQLKNIETASLNEKGQVKIVVPHRRDITIPLEKDEAQKLIDKLNELIPIEKAKEAERILASSSAERGSEEKRAESRFIADESERLR